MQPVASPLTTTCARAELLIPAREVRGQCRHGRAPSATVLEHGDIRAQQKQLAAPGGQCPIDVTRPSAHFTSMLQSTYELNRQPTSCNAPRTPRARRLPPCGSELVCPNSHRHHLPGSRGWGSVLCPDHGGLYGCARPLGKPRRSAAQRRANLSRPAPGHSLGSENIHL